MRSGISRLSHVEGSVSWKVVERGDIQWCLNDFFKPHPLHPLPPSASNPRTVCKYRVWANSFWSSCLWKLWFQGWFRDGRPEAQDPEGCVIWCSLSFWALCSCVDLILIWSWWRTLSHAWHQTESLKGHKGRQMRVQAIINPLLLKQRQLRVLAYLARSKLWLKWLGFAIST